MISTFLRQLREKTHPIHQRLEQTTNGHQLMKAFEPAGYTTLLQCHYWYHLEVAHQLSAHPEFSDRPLLDWPACARIDALEADLRSLSLSQTLPHPSVPKLAVESPAFAVGMCYVSEGSCMGNQQMYRAFQPQASFQSLGADRFFRESSIGFSSRWKEFLQRMIPYGEAAYEELEAGALAGFARFETLFLSDRSIHE